MMRQTNHDYLTLHKVSVQRTSIATTRVNLVTLERCSRSNAVTYVYQLVMIRNQCKIETAAAAEVRRDRR